MAKKRTLAFLLVLTTMFLGLSPATATDTEDNKVTGITIANGANPGDVIVSWTKPLNCTDAYYVYLYKEVDGEPNDQVKITKPDCQHTSADFVATSFGSEVIPDGGIEIGLRYMAKVVTQQSTDLFEAFSANSLLVLGQPDPPTSLVATRTGDGEITLRWQAPENLAGGTISSYEVLCTPSCGREIVLTGATLATEVIIEDLNAETSYEFNVIASNTFDSILSESSNSKKPIVAPGAPTTLTSTGGPERVSLTWVAGARGSSVSTYQIDIFETTDNEFAQPVASETISGSLRKATVSGLISGTSYVARVTPNIGSVNGNSRVGSSFVAQSASVPSAPLTPKATVAKQVATVSWSAPASDGGRSITSYVVKSSTGSFTCSTNKSSCTISGLKYGQAYTFTVTARNALGASSASTKTGAVTPVMAISGAKWKAKSKGKTLTVTYKPLKEAAKYTYEVTGSTKKSGSCKVKGKGKKKLVTCSIKLKKGSSTVSVKAITSSKVVYAMQTQKRIAR